MIGKSEFLSLVKRFLSWLLSRRFPPGAECRNVSLYEENGRTFVVYDMFRGGKSKPTKRTMDSGLGFDGCVSNSISYMCRCTQTSGKEELDLFLSSMGF